jgi:hypothetical protein
LLLAADFLLAAGFFGAVLVGMVCPIDVMTRSLAIPSRRRASAEARRS